LKPQRAQTTGLLRRDRRIRFIPIIITEKSIMPASTNSSGGFSKPKVTAVAFVDTVENCVAKFDCVCVTDELVVEKIVVVVVSPMTLMDRVDVITVDVVALATTVVAVVLVSIVE
jgi:hypothetical protein